MQKTHQTIEIIRNRLWSNAKITITEGDYKFCKKKFGEVVNKIGLFHEAVSQRGQAELFKLPHGGGNRTSMSIHTVEIIEANTGHYDFSTINYMEVSNEA